MKRRILTILATLLIIIFLTSCPSSPPLSMDESFNPYSSPLAPTNVRASNGYSDTIELKWEKTEGATSYQIWAIEREKYGTINEIFESNAPYSKLQSRGFSLLDIVSSNSYKLTDVKANSAYIFSVVAQKIIKGDFQSSIVLYSEPSAFTEGSTNGEVHLSLAVRGKTITLYWDISNLYSSLESFKELFDYNISIYKKLSSSPAWDEPVVIENEKMTDSYSFSSSLFSIDTDYDFFVQIEILDENGKKINTIKSDLYTLQTDSKIYPDPVFDIKTDAGEEDGSITLSFMPSKMPDVSGTVERAFIIQRATESSTWENVNFALTEDETGRYSFTDTQIEDNTLYSYRIINGYKYKGTYYYQDEEDALKIENIYSLWKIENAKFTFKQDESKYSGVLTLSFDYNPPSLLNKINWKLGGERWLETDLSARSPLDKTTGTIEPTKEKTSYVLSQPFAIDASSPLTFFSFTFEATLGEKQLIELTSSEDFILGETKAVDLITDVSATSNWVNVVRLTWNENSLYKEDGEEFIYEIYEGSNLLENLVINSDNTLKSVAIPATDKIEHKYRIKVTNKNGNFYVSHDEIVGAILPPPVITEASDSTSTDEIDISWEENNDEELVYTLLYSYDGTNWTELAHTEKGSAKLMAKKDETDGSLVSFVLEVYNKEQPNSPKLKSEIEKGSVFGPALINARILNSGLDPEKITIEWDEIAGASYYRIMRNETLLPGKFKSTEYIDKASVIETLEESTTPLSEVYTYTVIPYLEDGRTSTITSSPSQIAVGSLFAPPKTINATKGEYTSKIVVTWSEVENATSYTLKRYIYSPSDNTYKEYDEIENVTSNTYIDDETSVITNDSVLYTVKANRGDTSSLYQSGKETIKNIFETEEYTALGYILHNASFLKAESVIDDNNYYRPYNKIQWKMVPGASEYKISNSLIDNVVISVDSISKYSIKDVVTNGLDKDAIGYLEYNPETKEFTYNDGNGVMTGAYFVTSYKIVPSHKAEASGGAENNSVLIRGLKAEDCINMVSSILNPAFKAADNSFGGDWWITNRIAWEYPEKNYKHEDKINFRLYTNGIDGNYPYKENYLSISNYTDQNLNLSLSTVDNICFDISNGGGAGNLGTDPLKIIGKEYESGKGIGPISVSHSGNEEGKLKDFTVIYKNINVNTPDSSGSYIVKIEGEEAKTIQDSSLFVRVLGK